MFDDLVFFSLRIFRTPPITNNMIFICRKAPSFWNYFYCGTPPNATTDKSRIARVPCVANYPTRIELRTTWYLECLGKLCYVAKVIMAWFGIPNLRTKSSWWSGFSRKTTLLKTPFFESLVYCALIIRLLFFLNLNFACRPPLDPLPLWLPIPAEGFSKSP